jgi:hypothetical protein
MAKPTRIILDVLSSSGLLLKQDKLLPNVITLVTGESLRTSWWSHPKGRLIFAVLGELADHPDVLFVKLLLGKGHAGASAALAGLACGGHGARSVATAESLGGWPETSGNSD